MSIKTCIIFSAFVLAVENKEPRLLINDGDFIQQKFNAMQASIQDLKDKLSAQETKISQQENMIEKLSNQTNCGSILSKMTCSGHCCPDGYTKHQESCYRIYNEIMSWPEAVTLCRVNGAHLVRIKNKDEFDYLKPWVLANTGLLRANELWVAGMEIEAEGEWVWPETMEKIAYLPWGPGENPNDVRYNCLCMSKSYSYDYAEIECDRKINFICEINLQQQ